MTFVKMSHSSQLHLHYGVGVHIQYSQNQMFMVVRYDALDVKFNSTCFLVKKGFRKDTHTKTKTKTNKTKQNKTKQKNKKTKHTHTHA
jgi:hypothetical protein